MSGWQQCLLGQVVTLQRGFDITQAQQTHGKYSVVSSSGIKSYHDEFQVKGPGVVIGRKGTLGSVFYLADDFWPHDTTLWVRDFHGNVPLFVFYYLQSYDLGAYDVGSSNPTLNRNHVHLLRACIPEPKEQRAIAAVLDSLDEKIKFLNRQNKTLEATADTLFRQWFIAAPQTGWEDRPLSSVASFLNGLACQKYPPDNALERLPVLKIRELSSGISDTSDWATDKVKPEYIVKAGDVIFAWSASLMVKVWDGARCVLNQHLFKVTSDKFPKWFYLMWCKHHLAEFIAISASHATTMGHIKRSDLDAAMVLVPSPLELETMSAQMSPLLEKQIALAEQIKTLEALRNILLPKLMSGEVRVAC
jgi:type I restriction enzyme S subunit